MTSNTAVVPQTFLAVTLGSRDIARQRRFYEAWGWTAVPYSNDEYVAFTFPSAAVAFFDAEKLAHEAGATAPSAAAFNGVTLAVTVPEKTEVDTVYGAAVAAGARPVAEPVDRPVAEPVDRPWGGRSGYVADPEGNRWEIAWIPQMAG